LQPPSRSGTIHPEAGRDAVQASGPPAKRPEAIRSFFAAEQLNHGTVHGFTDIQVGFRIAVVDGN
jgi:hypothetical protein